MLKLPIRQWPYQTAIKPLTPLQIRFFLPSKYHAVESHLSEILPLFPTTLQISSFPPSIFHAWAWETHPFERFTHLMLCLLFYGYTMRGVFAFYHLMRGRVTFCSVSHVEERHLPRDSCIWSFIFTTPPILYFPALSSLSRREFHTSVWLSAHPIPRSPCCSHSSCLRNYMRGREVYVSDFSPFISCGGEFYLSRFTHLIFWLCHPDLGRFSRIRFFVFYRMRERILLQYQDSCI